MVIKYQIADHRDYDPLNGKHNPIGLMFYFSTCEEHYFNGLFKKDKVIKPFLQSYEYLIVSASYDYGIVIIVPYCNFAKMILEQQIKKD